MTSTVPACCRSPQVSAPERRARPVWGAEVDAASGRVVAVREADAARDRGADGFYQLYSSSNCWLACPEGDDAADWIVRRNADRDAIPGNHLDAEAAHSAAELGQNFVSGIALHAVKTAAVHRDNSALHVDEVVLTQLLANPFKQ